MPAVGRRSKRGRIVVAAGTNGAGKSSIASELERLSGGAYFNPDRVAAELVRAGRSGTEANAEAWRLGYEGLRRAVDDGTDFSFETTLGGRSIIDELHRALRQRREVHVFYVGLASPELHLARVRARVMRGGHDIPEAKVRERYEKSLTNLLSLVGKATSIHVFDNSEHTDDGTPHAKLVLRMRGRKLVEPKLDVLLHHTPDWAKPVAMAAITVAGLRPRRRRR